MAERPEQAAGNSRKGENRKEDQQRRKRSVDHGGADLEDGVKHDARLGSRLWQSAILAQAAHDILDADHGIIDHLADGDCKPAERHRVEGFAHPLQGQARPRAATAGLRCN